MNAPAPPPTRRTTLLRHLFVIAVPAIPLIGYLLSGTAPFTLSTNPEIPPHLRPQPRFLTGLPVVDALRKGVRRRGPSPFTWKAIRQRASKWDVRKLETPRWRRIATDRLVIRSDARIDDVRFAGVYLEETLRLLESCLGGEPLTAPCDVRIFRSRAEFLLYAGSLDVPDADSFYNPGTRETVVYRNRADPRDRMAAALLHEVTHLYMHRAFGATGPLWLAEGLAEFFARHDVSTGRLRAGIADGATVRFLRDSLERGGWIPARALLEFDRERFYGPRSKQAYAQSWLLVHYLMARRGGGDEDILRACLEGENLTEWIDPADLEGELRKYLAEFS